MMKSCVRSWKIRKYDEKKNEQQYSIQELKETIFDSLSHEYETTSGQKIRGDKAIMAKLFEIIISGDNKEKMQAISLYKELLNLLERANKL